MPYGVLSTGFALKTREQVLADIRDQIAAAPNLGANINTTAESTLGQLVEIFGSAVAELHEVAQGLYTQQSLAMATGAALANLAANYGLAREGAVASTVTLTLAGTPTTVIPAGSAVTLGGGSNSRWTIDTAATIGGGGTVNADFTCDDTGPIAALAGSTWTIATPVTGWTGATNGADAEPGRDVESDAAFRRRIEQAVTASAGSGIDAIQSAVTRVSGVTQVVVIENDSASDDADGRPPHSFEVVAIGGVDASIAAAIWDSKPAGIRATTTVSAPNQVSETVVDAAGNNQTVEFSRPDEVDVYVEVDYTPRSSFPSNGESLILSAILDFGASLVIGAGAYPPDILDAIYDRFGTRSFSSLELRMGLVASPVTASPVPTSLTQIAAFDSSRITITRV